MSIQNLKREIHRPLGNKLTCKNWQIEAAYRMIQHNLDRENAEKSNDRWLLDLYWDARYSARNL